jgi:hypothetical protein
MVSSSLAFGDLPTKNGSLAGSLGIGRKISASALSSRGLLNDGETLWFSFIAKYGSGIFALASDSFHSGGKPYIENKGTGIGFMTSRGKNYAAMFRGKSFLEEQLTVVRGDNVWGGYHRNGDVGLVVGKITWGAEEDIIQIYDPGVDLVLGDPISTLKTKVDQSTFNTVTAKGWAGLDEIRFGDSYYSVLAGSAAQKSR